MPVTVTTEPQIEPLTLEDAKAHLRIDGNDSDGEIDRLIIEARKYVEGRTGRALITQTRKFQMDYLPSLILVPFPPIQSVSAINYYDESDSQQQLGASTYRLDDSSEPARIELKSDSAIPSVKDRINAVAVTFVCGYGAERDDVPEGLRRAMKLYIERSFDMPTGAYAAALDDALEAAIAKYKIENIEL